jgi:hypothetical protein
MRAQASRPHLALPDQRQRKIVAGKNPAQFSLGVHEGQEFRASNFKTHPPPHSMSFPGRRGATLGAKYR